MEAVSLIENDHTAVIDTSTAHRVSEAWAYGFAELSRSHRQAIVTSKRVANPGCHASGFIAGVYPLVNHGVIPEDFPLTAYSLTGYSGGGKKLIAASSTILYMIESYNLLTSTGELHSLKPADQ